MRRTLAAALLAATLLSGGVVAAAATKKIQRKAAPAPVVPVGPDAFLAANARARGVVQTASGLQYRVIMPGTGTEKPSDGDVALLTYVGKLTDGTIFDQSAQPTPLPVAAVVPGFSEALKAMPRGSHYRVWIKPSLGYGEAGSAPIPANAVLVFDIELIDFISQAAFEQMRQQQAGMPGASPPPTAPQARRHWSGLVGPALR
jgi:FKBP-type peptidyl-prolyl cis-trans isomerase